MKARSFRPVFWLVIFVLMFTTACGGGDKPEPKEVTPKPAVVEATEAPVKTAEPVATEKPAAVTEEPASQPSAPEGMVATLDDLENAVVDIVVEGSYKDPYEGWAVNQARGGTGFIIDPAGLAVTNNHVVTGAAQLKVFVGRDQTPRNARVLGVSECSDLAVIDIEGDGYPFVKWYDGQIKAGMDVFAAGFPGSAAGVDYTLTKGIISKARASLNSSWAAVDNVIEHTAKINPGNSGGPLVTENGEVVGVNYAGDSERDQNYAISQALARSVVEELSNGNDVDSLGINGEAVTGDLEGSTVTGIWVRSVKSGSPADKARVIPGDIVTEVEGQVLQNPDMGDYCSVLRAHDSTDTLTLQVVRTDTLDIMEGQTNGREMAVVGKWSSSSSSSSSSGSTSTVEGVTVNPNASASGDIYYDNQFEGGDLSEWIYFLTNGREKGFSANIANGRLRFDISENNTWTYFLYNTYSFGNVRIDVTAENLGRNDNNVSLICRYDANQGWYEFNIANSGVWTILRYDMATQTYRTLYTGGSTQIKTGKNVNTYTAVCEDDELTLGINGYKIRTVTDRSLKSGTAGLSVSSFGALPITVEFDNFTLTVP